MINARDEFLGAVEGKELKCAVIYGDDGCWSDDPVVKFALPIGYNPAQYKEFLNNMNFKYDSGYGGQELFGVIWYADGTWSTRGEYDGSEWWEYHQCPDIPSELV